MNRKTIPLLGLGLLVVLVSSVLVINYLGDDSSKKDEKYPPPEERDPTFGDLLTDEIIDIMSDFGVSQSSFALAKNGEILYQNATGLGFGNAIENSTLFRIGELSMIVTAIATMKLAEDGDLVLTEKAFTILNQYSLAGADSRITDITIEHLLSHTSGWDVTPPPTTFWFNRNQDPTYRDNDVKDTLGLTSLPVSIDNIINFALTLDLDHDPGSSFSLNNVNYLLLGRIIEKKTGETYDDWVKANVLAPIGITNMRLAHSLEEDVQDDEAFHTDAFGGYSCQNIVEGSGTVRCGYGNINFENMWAASGWLANSDSLVKLFSAIDYDDSVPDFLSSSSLDLMYANPRSQNFDNNRYTYYGYGLEILDHENGTDAMAAGVLVTVSSFAIIRSDGYVWAITFNEHPVNIEINTGEDFQITFRQRINDFISTNADMLEA